MSTENEVKTNVAEVTEKIEVTEEKTVIPAVKETAEKVVEAGKEAVETVKDKVEEAVEAVKAPARSKKATWWNRILSAIIGAIMSFAATIGITSDQIAEQKARTEQIKVAVNEALTAIKKGDIAAAKTALEKAVEPTKELINESKKVIDKTKEVLTAQQQAGAKAIEAVQTQYTTK